jgi:hypothetical protein
VSLQQVDHLGADADRPRPLTLRWAEHRRRSWRQQLLHNLNPAFV